MIAPCERNSDNAGGPVPTSAKQCSEHRVTVQLHVIWLTSCLSPTCGLHLKHLANVILAITCPRVCNFNLGCSGYVRLHLMPVAGFKGGLSVFRWATMKSVNGCLSVLGFRLYANCNVLSALKKRRVESTDSKKGEGRHLSRCWRCKKREERLTCHFRPRPTWQQMRLSKGRIPVYCSSVPYSKELLCPTWESPKHWNNSFLSYSFSGVLLLLFFFQSVIPDLLYWYID